jgi:hypothetical protein
MCSKRIQRLSLVFRRLQHEAALLRGQLAFVVCCAKSEKRNRFFELLPMIDAASCNTRLFSQQRRAGLTTNTTSGQLAALKIAMRSTSTMLMNAP